MLIPWSISHGMTQSLHGNLHMVFSMKFHRVQNREYGTSILQDRRICHNRNIRSDSQGRMHEVVVGVWGEERLNAL